MSSISTPLRREILWSWRVRTKSNTDEKMSMNRSIIWKLCGVMVPKIATGNPMTMQMLKILLPIMLPTIRSVSLRRAATMVVTSSGKDVPNAIIVRATTLSEMPIVVAIEEALLTMSWLPMTSPTSPKMVIRNDLPSLY